MDPNPINLNHLSFPQLTSFWAKVEKTENCWNWKAAKIRRGYPSFAIGSKKHQTHRKVQAHRLSYTIAKGHIPANLDLDHLCRNPSCVNPDHLEAVTHQENVRRGKTLGNTWSQGEKHAQAKLTNSEAQAIRDAEGTQEEIARAFGVSQSTVSNIKTGRNWKSV